MGGKRNKGKTEKRASVEAKTKREATGVGRPVAKTQAKAIAKPEVKANAVAQVKAVSKKKIVTEKKGAPANFSPKVEDEATQVSRCRSVKKAEAETKSMCKDKAGIDTCAGEETSVGSRFQNGEAETKSMYKDKAGIDTCAGEETSVGSRFQNGEAETKSMYKDKAGIDTCAGEETSVGSRFQNGEAETKSMYKDKAGIDTCAGEETSIGSRFQNGEAETKSMYKDKAGIDTCAGEETSVGSRFQNGEETDNSSSAKDEGKADTGAPSCAEKLEPVASTSYKARPGAEEEEEENVIGNWFWDGDETSFDPDPKPVSRILRPQPVDEINEKDRPKDWSEVTIWPNAPAVTPAVLGFRSQVTSETKPPSYIVLGSAEENARASPEETESLSKSIVSCSESLPEHPFGSDPCIQTIEQIRRQIKIREMNGIKPFACPCKMECYMTSEEFEKLITLLESTTDPLIHKVAQIAMGIIKVHPFAQEFINEVGVVTLIESLLSFPSSERRKNAVFTLNEPGGLERHRKVELHVKHMCKETMCFPLNSPGQQSGLKILGQLTTDVNRHHIVASYLSDFYYLLSQGNRKTRNLVLKVLLNMSENPVAAREMISSRALGALKLIFNQREAKASLVNAVAIFINIKEHIRKGSIVVVDHSSYSTLMDLFREVKMIIETL